MVALDLGRPVTGKLPRTANWPEILDPVQVKDALPNDDDRLGRWCLKNVSLPITTIVVTLPDPVNSHLSLDFDRRIDALQSAALDAQYVLDQFWLPWDSAAASGTEDSQKVGKDRVLRRLRQNQPGLQIFRSRDYEHPKALFVFMVGETPTQGVNLAEFENAITYVREVQNAVRQSTTSEIKILGPGFSGSIPVLSEVLKHQIAGNACCFEIIPSSATDHDLLSNLSKAVEGAGTVHSVLHDDDAALERFLVYARDSMKIRATDVAIVSESQTAFGSKEFLLNVAQSATPANAPPPRQCWYDNPDENSSLRDCTLRLNFPREIYRLRSAYPDAPHLAAGSARADNQPTSGLTLNLKTYAGRENDLPSFSREQLPLSQEAVMLSLAETIHRRKIKMVGVEASDVFDSLFVMRFLQEFSPDVRLFVLDSDLLFIRAADNLSLQGTLAVTDYPLSSILQSWQGSKKVLRSFPSRNAEVTYNAFLALLGATGGMRDYSATRLERTKCNTGEPTASEPMLFLTVVSRNGFQPVHLLDCKWHEDKPIPFIAATPAPPGVPSDRPSGGYLLLCGLLLAMTLAQLALAFYGRCASAPFLVWVLEYFHIADESEVRTQKAYLLANSFIVMAVLDFIVFLPVWRVTYQTPYDGIISVWYLALSGLSLAAAIANLVTAIALSVKYKIFASPEGRWLGLSWTIGLIYYFVWFSFTFSYRYDSAFFLQRSLDLSNGASPLLPHLLLFIAIYLWSITNLRRVHLWETRRQSIFFTSLDDQYRSHFADLEEGLHTGFRNLFFSRRSWIILVLVLCTLLSLRPFSHIAGFEPYALKYVNVFDLLYVSYLLMCMAFLTHALLRFVACWAGLQKILRRLERQPIRHAFDRLPKKTFSWTPIWHAGGARRSFVLQTRALECLRKLNARAQTHTLPDALKSALPKFVKNLESKTAKLLDAEAAGFLDLEPENEACQEEDVRKIANSIAKELLIPYWLRTGASESLEPSDKGSGKGDSGVRYLRCDPPPTPDDSIVIAEEFVALRFVSFIRYIGVQLRNLLSFVVAGFILCVASVRSYPFLSQRTIGWALTLIFFALGIPVVIAFAQMDKDAILSRLSDTQPGKLDSAFYTRLVAYGALPLLTVVASQFPSIGRFLFSWIQPAIEALH